MDNIISNKIHIGISACMFGCQIRYNKNGMDITSNLGRENSNFIWHPICPENLAGLGVPRSPIRIVGGNGFDIWENGARVKNRKGKDITVELKEAALGSLKMLKNVGAISFVFMEGSPSCGVYRTTLKNKRLGSPPGVFGASLLKEGFFLIPAIDLQSPIKRWDWLRRLYAFTWLKDIEILSKKDLYTVWHTLKFLCQEISRKDADHIGRELASLKELDYNQIEYYKKTILNLLRRPSTVPKIKEMLWKNYVYYRKKHGFKGEFINPPTSLRNMTNLVRELTLFERRLIEEGKLPSSSPIVFRGR